MRGPGDVCKKNQLRKPDNKGESVGKLNGVIRNFSHGGENV